jgi:hypothetical protein
MLFCAVLVRRKTALVLATPTITTKMTRAAVQMYRGARRRGDGAAIKGAVATMLTGSDWVDKIKAAATKTVMKFGDARWYIGSQLKNQEEQGRALGDV